MRRGQLPTLVLVADSAGAFVRRGISRTSVAHATTGCGHVRDVLAASFVGARLNSTFQSNDFHVGRATGRRCGPGPAGPHDGGSTSPSMNGRFTILSKSSGAGSAAWKHRASNPGDRASSAELRRAV